MLVIHHHFRPGGVRRVIEQALPGIVAARPAVREVVLAGDAEPEAAWLAGVRERVAPVPVRFEAEPALGYGAEQTTNAREQRQRLRAWLARVLSGEARRIVVWLHNPGLGRNALAIGAIADACRRRGVAAVWHHHDWWFDHRWQHWPELRRIAGTIPGVARALLGGTAGTLQVGINREDVAMLRSGFGDRAVWWPNPVALKTPPRARSGVGEVRRWVAERIGSYGAPFWLLPCRFLRRKNIAEAILLACWLRPEAWVVTTAGPSSAAERPAFDRLRARAAAGGWRVALGILTTTRPGAPTVLELLGACEAVLFTSVLEGFGLPYLEAAAAGRPLVGRALPNVAPDLHRLGFRFPTLYDDLLVAPDAYDVRAEVARQRTLFAEWRRRLPVPFRRWAGVPPRLARPAATPVPFSRLTLTAQLEVLDRPVDETRAAGERLNPWISEWRDRAERAALPTVPWPGSATARVSVEAYGRRFWRSLARVRGRGPVARGAAERLQRSLVRQRLAGDRMYPILWAPET